MMRKINIVSIVLLLLSAATLLVLGILFDTSMFHIILGFFVVVSYALIVCLSNFVHNQNRDLQTPIIREPDVDDSVDKNDASEVRIVEKEIIVEKTSDWSKAMYKKYSPAWNELFENIKYPANQQQKAQINLLCWEIASRTIDYLRVDNNDINVLERNRRSVQDTIDDKPDAMRELKEFYLDPTTVPAKVLAVHDALSDNMPQGMMSDATVFGYSVHLTKNEE